MLNSRTWLLAAVPLLSAMSARAPPAPPAPPAPLAVGASPARAQPATPAPTATPSPTPVADMPGHVMADSPHLTMRGFSNIDYAIHEEGEPQTFALGQFDLLITSPLSDSIT